MTLLYKAGAAVLLVILTLCLQCAGLVVLIRWLRRTLDHGIHNSSPFRFAVLVMQSSAAVIVLHGLQVLLWASGYHWLCLPSWDSAFYFSANSYVTVGYSDVVLPSNWRMLGPLERITGVMMCGVTVSFLFTMVKRFVGEARSPK
jgi:voltage-gated potassium channel